MTNTTYQNMWHATKETTTVLRGKFIVLNAYQKRGKIQILEAKIFSKVLAHQI